MLILTVLYIFLKVKSLLEILTCNRTLLHQGAI